MGVDISKRIQRGGRAAHRRLSQGFLSTPGISMPHRLGHSAIFSQSAGVDVQMAISSLLCPPEEGGETSDTGTNPPALISAFLPEFPLHKSPIEDHHQVLGLIAKGSLGPILKLKDISKDKFYAVKVLSKSEILKQKLLEQSKGEVIIQRRLKHPFIHKLHCCWQTRHHIFIMCDYCSAGDLYTYWLLRGRFQEAEVRLFAAEMGGALGFLQDLGIMHRDIKMENILISDRGHLRLSDFGLSRRLVRGGRAFTICGTIPYMAPEVLSGGPYNHAADWWSLGILLFTLVAGEFPLAAEPDHRRMWRKARDFPYAIPKTFSSALALLLTDLLCKNPANRLRHLESFKMQPFFRGISFDSYILQKTPVDFILKLREHPDWAVKSRRGASLDQIFKFDCERLISSQLTCSYTEHELK